MFLNCGVLEYSWKPLDNKEIQSVHPEEDQFWEFTGRPEVEGLVCCGPWRRKEADTTERRNWTEQHKNLHNLFSITS